MTKRTRRTGLALAVTAALALGPVPGEPAAKPPLSAYRGLGAWVDIYDDPAWADPEGMVADLASKKVRTLYLETCNYSCANAIKRPDIVERFIHAAHAKGMAVVAWYLPGFDNLKRDLNRSMAAIELETSQGQRFDSFALDIEARIVQPASKRNKRVLTLSRRIRERAGGSYPLGAIIPPYFYEWPAFPYRGLANHYDVFLPMNYFTGQVDSAKGARDHTIRNIKAIRKGTGKRSIPIHSIAGIADRMSGPETRAVVRAGREYGILGTSLYDALTSGPEDWRQLRSVPANPRQSPALPLRPGRHRKPLGNLPGADRTHPKEVFFTTGGLSGGWRLRFGARAIDSGEVKVLLNWKKVRTVPENEGWKQRSFALPRKLLRSGGPNVIGFVAKGRYPNWSEWAIRRVTLVRA